MEEQKTIYQGQPLKAEAVLIDLCPAHHACANGKTVINTPDRCSSTHLTDADMIWYMFYHKVSMHSEA